MKNKVTNLDIVVRVIGGKPYYSLKYKELGNNYFNVGYSSYSLENVITWKNEYFDMIQWNEDDGWIPVDERLPEDERECLVTLEKVYGTPEIFMGIASYLKFGNDGYWNEKKYGYLEWDKYSDGHGGTKMYKVVAWMPQPELYRKEKNNE